MDSPRSERSGTRFSTPVSDLDDHRFQPSSLPRNTDISSGSHDGGRARRGTANSTVVGGPSQQRADLLRVNEALEQAGSVSRDFEHAVADDEQDELSPRDQEAGAHGSSSHGVTRRGTLRLPLHQDRPSKSRSSSTSSQSSSAPNSVDAFADPRRRERANTVGSRGQSDLDLCLQRTVSAGTPRRRPTFSDGNGNNTTEAIKPEGSVLPSAEDDVCFPPAEESSKTYTIDFEVLEEFVAEKAHERTPVHQLRHGKHNAATNGRGPAIFDDLRPKHSLSAIPKITMQEASPVPSNKSGVIEELSEKEKLDKLENLGDVPDTPAMKHTQQDHTRFSFFSSELDSTIHAADLGDLVMPGETFRDLFELDPDGGVWWLDMYNPTEEEIQVIAKAFSIHPLTTEDIKTQEMREKVELFKQYYFVCFRSFYQVDKTSEDFMEPVNVYAVVFREGVLSFTFCQSPHAANVRRRIGKLRDYVSLSSDWICYAMIDDIVDSFGPVIHEIEQETDVIEDQVFVARADDFSSLLRQIGECRRKVMGLMRLLGGKADVIKGFAKRCNEQYSVTPRGEIGLYLGDIQDHVVTMMSNLGHFEKMLSRSHSNYLAQLSVDSIAQGNRANEVLSKITLIATILVPLNLICGLFGMNVNVPGKSDEGLTWFFAIIGVIGAIVVVSLVAAKRFRFI